MIRLVVAAMSGVIFSLGLGLGGMTQPEKIVAFLDVTGNWDPSLIFVMGGALLAHAVTRLFIVRRQRPVLAASFPAGDTSKPDYKLLGGSALFGIGWGLAGYCPGPAFTSMASFDGSAGLFFAAMMGGMALFSLLQRRTAPRPAEAMERCRPPGAGS